MNPNPDLVGDLFWGVFKPQWIRLALTLDIFTPLASNPSSAEQVAQACGCDPFPIQALLDYFCAVRILEKCGDLYALTPTAETFLARGSQAPAPSRPVARRNVSARHPTLPAKRRPRHRIARLS